MAETTNGFAGARPDDARPNPARGRRTGFVFARRGRRYLRVVSWLVTTFVRSFPLATLAMVALPLLAVGLKVLALAIPIGYIHAQIGQRDVDAKLIHIPYDPEGERLLAFAFLALLLGTCAAGAQYGYAVFSLRRSRLFVQRLATLGGEILCRETGFHFPTRAAKDSGAFATGLFGTDGLSLIRAIRVGSMLIVPALLLATSVAIMLSISFGMTMLMALLAGVFGVPLYLVNMRIIRASQVKEELVPVGAASRALVRGLRESQDPVGAVAAYASGSVYQRAIGGVREILITKDQAKLVSELLVFTAITGVLFMFGYGGAGVNWSLLLAFFLAMHHGVTAAGQLAMGMTAFNRFYPQISRVADFFLLNADPHSPGPHRLQDITIEPRGQDDDEDEYDG